MAIAGITNFMLTFASAMTLPVPPISFTVKGVSVMLNSGLALKVRIALPPPGIAFVSWVSAAKAVAEKLNRTAMIRVVRVVRTRLFIMVLSLGRGVLSGGFILIVEHTIFGPLDIIKISALDCPNEKKPGTGADAEREQDQDNN
jgi:hypothetical protein